MDSKEKAQQLMEALMPYAEQQLGENGGFLPYGGVITADDKVHMVQFADDEESEDPQTIFDHATAELRKGAQDGEWTTTALVTDVTVTKQGEEEGVPAVSFALDDAEGNSVEVFFPYTIKEGGAVDFGTAFAQPGTRTIFSSTQDSVENGEE